MTTSTAPRVDIAKDARDLYRAYLALDRASGDSALDARLAELVKPRASQLNGCAYCVDLHAGHDAGRRPSESRRRPHRRLGLARGPRSSPRASARRSPSPRRSRGSGTTATSTLRTRPPPSTSSRRSSRHSCMRS